MAHGIFDGRGKTLAIGFGTAVAMWAVCYIALIKPGLVVGELLFAMTLGCLVLGGMMAGRHAKPDEAPWWAGAKVGLLAASLNLLIVGALLVDPTTHRPQHNALLWIAGNFGVSLILGTVGGLLGTMGLANARSQPPVNWFNRFVVVASVTVFLLLITGGLVTGLRAGLAVPDWPTSFGHNMLLYPLSEMNGGKYFEHTHRLYGMLVGVTAITLAAGLVILDRRTWLRALGIVYLLMVAGQGVLGGTRVTETSITLAVIHGVFGQIVFATICCISAFTSTTWMSDRPRTIKPSAATDRTYSLVLPCALLVQLALGALYRHLRRAHDNPPEPVHLLYTHIIFALMVTGLLVFVAGRAWGGNKDQPVLPRLGKAMFHAVGLQLVLGAVAMMLVWSRKDATPVPMLELIITSAHQITGAWLLAHATLLALWTRRLLAAEPASR